MFNQSRNVRACLYYRYEIIILFFKYIFSRIDNQHVQFHVAANPASVTAHQMAKRIGTELDYNNNKKLIMLMNTNPNPIAASDEDLKSRLDEDVGVQIDRAAAGPKVKYCI